MLVPPSVQCLCAIQWLYGGAVLCRDRQLLLPLLLGASAYLWLTDQIAISDGIWWISEEYTLGHHMAYDGWLGLPDVPVEEATFFVVTNMMCIQGVHLFLDALVHLQ